MAKRIQRRNALQDVVEQETTTLLGAIEPIPLFYDYELIEAPYREKIRRSAENIKRRFKRTVQDIFETGQEFNTVKSHLPHGQFHDWLKIEFEFTPRLAQMYMNAAERLGTKSEKFSHLGQSVIYLLGAPSTPEQAIEEIEERIDAGEKVTVADTKKTINKFKDRDSHTAEEAAIPAPPQDIFVQTQSLDDVQESQPQEVPLSRSVRRWLNDIQPNTIANQAAVLNEVNHNPSNESIWLKRLEESEHLPNIYNQHELKAVCQQIEEEMNATVASEPTQLHQRLHDGLQQGLSLFSGQLESDGLAILNHTQVSAIVDQLHTLLRELDSHSDTYS